MTALGINLSDTDTTFDFTGLTSGHPRPLAVEQAHQDMLDAWANYNAACDTREEYGSVTHEEIQSLYWQAIAKDQAYSATCATWQASLEDCACRPGRPGEDERTCAACRARQELNSDAELPY